MEGGIRLILMPPYPKTIRIVGIPLAFILSGCAIYPLNKEYDARISNHDEMTLNMGASNAGKSDRFRDSLADLPQSLIGGYSLSSAIPGFIPLSRYLDKVEIGVGGVPIPFAFTLDLYAKYNFLTLPTRTFFSVYSNMYGAQMVSEYMGYSLRGGGIITQEIFWNAFSDIAISSGIMFNKNEYGFYRAFKSKVETDNITRMSEGTYVPLSVIVNVKSLYLQCSYDYRLREETGYTISKYPDPTKPIPYIGSHPDIINVSMGYRFRSWFRTERKKDVPPG